MPNIPTITALGLLLAGSANAQPGHIEPVSPQRYECQWALHDRALVKLIPSLALQAVRQRACDCILGAGTAAAEPASAVAGTDVSARLADVAPTCIAGAIAAQPLPALPGSTMAALANSIRQDARPGKLEAALVRMGDGCKAPQYPPLSARANATGTTQLTFRVDRTGRILDADIVHSAGASAAHKLLDASALFSLMSCRFEPTRIDGEAVEGQANVHYVWQLQ